MNNNMLSSKESVLDAHSNETDNNSNETDNNGKAAWVKPTLQKIDAGSDTQASKPNNAAFESTPAWGIS